MKRKIFDLLVLGTAMMIFGCGEHGPVSPEVSQSEEGAVLAKHGKRQITEVTALSTICKVIPGEQSIVDNTLIIRRQVHSLIIESDDPRLNGTQSARVNIRVDLATGTVDGWGKSIIEPEEVDGTWEIVFTVQSIGGAPLAGNAFGHGTGDLEGYRIFLEIQEVPAGPDPPCEIAEPVPGAPKTQTKATGFIGFFER